MIKNVFALSYAVLANVILISSCLKPETAVSDPELTPHPRNPLPQSFEMLESYPNLVLDRGRYVDFLRVQPRYGSVDYSMSPPGVPKLQTDDITFYRWLVAQRLPREFASMLYDGAPEVTYYEGLGSIYGVDYLIRTNGDSDWKNVREAGFFAIGSASNGDPLVIDIGFRGNGEVAFIPLETMWDMTAEQLQAIMVPIAASIGQYLERAQKEPKTMPGDYWTAKSWREKSGWKRP